MQVIRVVIVQLALLLSCWCGTAAAQLQQQVEVVVQSANLRAGPGTNQRIIGSAPRGAVFLVLAAGQDWYRVKVSSEYRLQAEEGYLHSSTVRELGGEVGATQQQAEQAAGTSPGRADDFNRGDRVRARERSVVVRAAPDHASRSVATLAEATVATVLEVRGDWLQVAWGSQRGYALARAMRPAVAAAFYGEGLLPGEKSPVTATYLSIFPGAGHFYTGETVKGAILAGGAVAGTALMFSAAGACSSGFDGASASCGTGRILGGLALVTASSVYAIFDGSKSARRMNARNGLPVRDAMRRVELRPLYADADGEGRPAVGLALRATF